MELSPETITALKTAATGGAIRAVTALGSRITQTLSTSLSGALREMAVNATTNFGPHLNATFHRCTKIKTLINPDEPANILTRYVALKFRCGQRAFDDYATIEEIRTRKRVVISGTGGSGKTIFTKYLWLALFERPGGRIPVFIELRQLNELESDDLLTLVYHSIVNTHSSVPRETFDKGVRSGLFAFILDGFDEVSLDKKRNAEKQILELSKNNPDCIVVVSGRPDDKFDSWQDFSNFLVQPLKRPQVEELISKLDFDKATKRKFLARLKADLYAKHKSFLSTPLLATLMLLTFNQYADIPEKIHLFYEQAFDTLFARHDALKESFKRDMRSRLSVDVFKRYFAYFCLVSYYESKIEFTETELNTYIARGLKIDDAKLNIQDFVKDLTESVCVLQRDGLSFVFTHRTFQEFFAAYCLSRIPRKHFRELVRQISDRVSDNVLPMLRDMNDSLLEGEFLLPDLQAFLAEFDGNPSLDLLHRYTLKGSINCHPARRGAGITFADPTATLSILKRLYKSEYAALEKTMAAFKRKDAVAIRDANDRWTRKYARQWSAKILVDPDGSCAAVVYGPDGSKIEEPADWFHETGFKEYASKDIAIARLIERKLSQKALKKDTAIDKIFGEA
ncbi:NACHT domain-containing protein [Rhodopseudomonas sp.]|uniref:NACHT domain-containing protein n=1 Tax=Rhodopseudomonas sp. TaxID=1078 RepID=UPI0039E6036B